MGGGGYAARLVFCRDHAAIGQMPMYVALGKNNRSSHARVSPLFLDKRNYSIVLDTHTLGEQDHVVVSPFKARLPLPSPNAVSLAAKFRVERFEGSASSIPFSSSRAEQPPVRRTGRHTQNASGSRPHHSNPTRLMRAGISNFAKKENYYV